MKKLNKCRQEKLYKYIECVNKSKNYYLFSLISDIQSLNAFTKINTEKFIYLFKGCKNNCNFAPEFSQRWKCNE